MKSHFNILTFLILSMPCFAQSATSVLQTEHKFEKCPNEQKLEAQFEAMNQRLNNMEQYLKMMATLQFQKSQEELEIKNAKIARLKEQQEMQDFVDAAPWYVRYGAYTIDMTQTIFIKVLLPIMINQIAHQLANKTLHYVGEKTDYVLGDIPEQLLPAIISSFVASRPHEWLFTNGEQRVTNQIIRTHLHDPKNRNSYYAIQKLQKEVEKEEFSINLEQKQYNLTTRLQQLKDNKTFQEDELRQIRNANPNLTEEQVRAAFERQIKIKRARQAMPQSTPKKNVVSQTQATATATAGAEALDARSRSANSSSSNLDL